MVYEPLYHGREMVTIKFCTGYSCTTKSVRSSNVWFQKISIPPPRREFHIGPPHPPGFSIFEAFFYPPHPFGNSLNAEYTPTPLWKNFILKERLKNQFDVNISEISRTARLHELKICVIKERARRSISTVEFAKKLLIPK